MWVPVTEGMWGHSQGMRVCEDVHISGNTLKATESHTDVHSAYFSL